MPTTGPVAARQEGDGDRSAARSSFSFMNPLHGVTQRNPKGEKEEPRALPKVPSVVLMRKAGDAVDEEGEFASSEV